MPTFVVGMLYLWENLTHAHDKRGHGTGLSEAKPYFFRYSFGETPMIFLKAREK